MRSEGEFEVLPLKLAYIFLADNGLTAEADEIRRSAERFGSYTTSLRRAKIVALLRRKGLLKNFIATKWTNGSTQSGQKKLNFYDSVYTKYEQSQDASKNPPKPPQDVPEAATKFALEEQLRDYLAENLTILESDLALWPVDEGDAVEFQVDEQGRSRRIDILARDRAGLPVVIELKVSRGHERTVGQALYYRARVKRRFGVQQARIFIVASEISPELREAASEVPDVVLFEYSLAVTVNRIPE